MSGGNGLLLEPMDSMGSGLWFCLLASYTIFASIPAIQIMKLNAAVAYIALLGLGSFGNAQLVQDACPAGYVTDTDMLDTRRQLSTRRRLASTAIVSNGFIKLGINDKGSLNVGGSTSSVSGERVVGMRVLLPDGEYESTAQGCPCEGWVSSLFNFVLCCQHS